jgi:U3 small nucleolar RNA-associated protein 19
MHLNHIARDNHTMSKLGSGLKRKRDNTDTSKETRKRRSTRNDDKASTDIEQLERRIAEDPSNNHKNVEALIQLLDPASLDEKTNVKAGVALCKIFSRLIASGNFTIGENGGKGNREISDLYALQYTKYRKTLIKVLRSVSISQRLALLHLCWRVLEQDAELLDNSIWTSDSVFKPLLSTLAELPDGTDVRESYVGEYMNQCHDCCYYSLQYFSCVFPSWPVPAII